MDSKKKKRPHTPVTNRLFEYSSSDSNDSNTTTVQKHIPHRLFDYSDNSDKPPTKKPKKTYSAVKNRLFDYNSSDSSDINTTSLKKTNSQRLFEYSDHSDNDDITAGLSTGLQILTSPIQGAGPLTRSMDANTAPIAGPSKPLKKTIQSEPIPGPSTRAQNSSPVQTLNNNAEEEEAIEPIDDSNWFQEETKVFENENMLLFIQKQDHQRQKVFRLEDHLFVMRVKLKNNKPPLLSSIRDIIEQAMTTMVNDLKSHYNAEEQNLIYVTIKQPGLVKNIILSVFK